MSTTHAYIPALKYRWLTPLYDPLISRFMREDIFKIRLIDQAQLNPGMSLLDLGCGTATLAIMIKQRHPQVEVSGMDADPQILGIGRKKVTEAGLNISLDEGLAYQLPYPDGHFDRVVSSLVMHHLSTEEKLLTLGEVRRVLKQQGELHIVDFGVPANPYARITASVMRRFEEVDDNINGRLIGYMRSAGFSSVLELGQAGTFFGTLTYYKAVK